MAPSSVLFGKEADSDLTAVTRLSPAELELARVKVARRLMRCMCGEFESGKGAALAAASAPRGEGAGFLDMRWTRDAMRGKTVASQAYKHKLPGSREEYKNDSESGSENGNGKGKGKGKGNGSLKRKRDHADWDLEIMRTKDREIDWSHDAGRLRWV